MSRFIYFIETNLSNADIQSGNPPVRFDIDLSQLSGEVEKSSSYEVRMQQVANEVAQTLVSDEVSMGDKQRLMDGISGMEVAFLQKILNALQSWANSMSDEAVMRTQTDTFDINGNYNLLTQIGRMAGVRM